MKKLKGIFVSILAIVIAYGVAAGVAALIEAGGGEYRKRDAQSNPSKYMTEQDYRRISIDKCAEEYGRATCQCIYNDLRTTYTYEQMLQFDLDLDAGNQVDVDMYDRYIEAAANCYDEPL